MMIFGQTYKVLVDRGGLYHLCKNNLRKEYAVLKFPEPHLSCAQCEIRLPIFLTLGLKIHNIGGTMWSVVGNWKSQLYLMEGAKPDYLEWKNEFYWN